EARAAGRTVFEAEESAKLWDKYARGRLARSSPYVDLDAGSDEYGGGRHWREILGKGRMPEEIIVALHPDTRAVHELVRRADVARVLEENPKKRDPAVNVDRVRGTSIATHDKKL